MHAATSRLIAKITPLNMVNNLTERYAMQGPRYTSYPTVPYWDKQKPTIEAWEERMLHTFLMSNSDKGISLYIHLPYCESLCTYCGCNTRITKNHRVEEPYIMALLTEWSHYLALMSITPRLAELHIGGGTPTFFKPENLLQLCEGILSTVVLAPHAELSFEGHPNNTTKEHLEALAGLGFKRVSFGLQDLDPRVQKAINRIQPIETVNKAFALARQAGYDSVNVDLDYGLPFQTLEGNQKTIHEVIRLRPERIAFYSYAHVPWLRPGQRAYDENDLPAVADKRAMYEQGKQLFLEAGYQEVGMDHFALPGDALLEAQQQGSLHRNFMGYTTSSSNLLIGLGASAISDCGTAFIQNHKDVETWMEQVLSGEWAFFRGHRLTEEDIILRKHILELICRYETNWESAFDQCPALFEALERLQPLQEDGLINLLGNRLYVSKQGKPFIRNICMAFDAKLHRNIPTGNIFSSTV